MVSSKLIFFLMSINITVAVACAFEGNWWKCLYWMGAATINFSIAMMK